METKLYILTKVDKSYDGELYVDSSIYATEQEAIEAMQRDFQSEMNDIESDEDDQLTQNGNIYTWYWEGRELSYIVKSQKVTM